MGIFHRMNGQEPKNWYPLDNAAKIFPAVTNEVRTSVFRLSVELKEAINLASLQLALNQSLKELPYFGSQLKRGFFWYWLEPSESHPRIQFDDGPPCRAFKTHRQNHLLMRILAKENQISAEFNHVLTDGGGGLQFLNCLLKHYGHSRGWEVEDLLTKTDEDPDYQSLTEDSYKRYFRKHLPKPVKLRKAYHLPFKVKRFAELKTVAAEVSTRQIISLARNKQISLTEYLASVYLFTLQKFYLLDHTKRPFPRKSILRVEIPVNLRKIFPSNTIRNFALFVMPEIDPRLGAYSFDEITRIVHHYMQLETDHRQIQRIIRRNVGGEKNPIIRGIPLAIKVFVLKLIFKSSGPLLYSGVLTNLGAVQFPEGIANKISRFRFTPPPPDPSIRVNSALISFQDSLIICFGNQSTSTKFEKEFLRFLQQEGLSIKILKS